MEEDDSLFHMNGVDLITWLQCCPLCNDVRKIEIAGLLRKTHSLRYALPLRLAYRQEVDISMCKLL